MERNVCKTVNGKRAVDGAGVNLVRVIGHKDTKEFDPFLMLDSFDSKNPDDYTKGFPWHPHRGIETVTYLIDGEINHEDSLGNKGKILKGQSQWMTAGSGIMHQEMPQEAKRMLGFQLWLNLPQKDKMTAPEYFEITKENQGEKKVEGGLVRIISGEFEGEKGAQPHHIKATVLDISLDENAKIELKTKPNETVFLFTILGSALVAGEDVPEKTAVLLSKGDSVSVCAKKNEQARFIFFSGKPLHEGIAWGGPIVMNTKQELELAFEELDKGTFIK